MANIINNYLLAAGTSEDISKLNSILENLEKTTKLLSQDIVGIYKPNKVRQINDEGFGLMPDFFLSEVIVWDIATGKENLAGSVSRLEILEHFRYYYDYAIEEAEDILFLYPIKI